MTTAITTTPRRREAGSVIGAESTALPTGLYELTMLDAALADGTAAKPAGVELIERGAVTSPG